MNSSNGEFIRLYEAGQHVAALHALRTMPVALRRRQVEWLREHRRPFYVPVSVAVEFGGAEWLDGVELSALAVEPAQGQVLALGVHSGSGEGWVFALALDEAGRVAVTSRTPACSGVDAAMRELVKRAGFPRAPLQLVGVRPVLRSSAEDLRISVTDGSAGLSACLETWRHFRVPFRVGLVAATGTVDSQGRVGRVTGLEAKASGLAREVPDVELFLVPEGQQDEGIPPSLRHCVKPVSSVSEAWDAVVGEGWLPEILAPHEAAERARQLERMQQHGTALALAQSVLARFDIRGPCDEQLQRIPAEHRVIQALLDASLVMALNCAHVGNSQGAGEWVAFRKAVISRFPAECHDLDSAASRGWGWAVESILAIDRLRPEEALASLPELVRSRFREVGYEERVFPLGSLSKVYLAMGDPTEASLAAAEQVRVARIGVELGTGATYQQLPRCYNNWLLTLAFVARKHRDDPVVLGEDIARFQAVLEDAQEELRKWEVHLESNQDALYLALAQSRLCGVTGGWEQARELMEQWVGGGAPGATGYPYFQFRRFYGEALARAGRTQEGIGQLRQAAQNAQIEGDYGRVVADLASAQAALFALSAGLDGWQEDAARFFEALRRHAPLLVPHADLLADPARVSSALEHHLMTIPF